MSRNRLTGDSFTPKQLAALPGTFNEGLGDDMIFLPAGAAAGAYVVTLTGAVAGQAVPGDGDQLDIADPFGVLAVGTTLQIVGKSGPNGAQIANAGAAADSFTLNTAGVRVLLTYSSAAGVWLAS